jgi:hypothetical protein
MNYIYIAEEFIYEGYNPLPLLNNKAPKLPKDHKFLYEPINNIEQRFKNCDKIGIACGNVSGGFYGLDFDCHKGQNLESIFNDFIENQLVTHLISENKLSVVKTPSGGYHFYFRLNKELKGGVISKWDDNTTMIEIRGNGQYLCTYPSENYTFLAGALMTEIVYIDQFEFNSLKTICESFSRHIIEQNNDPTKRVWTGKWNNDTIEGNFNNHDGEEIAKKLLYEAGWQLASVRKSDNVELWVRPNKSIDDGISATFGAMPKMFYVFTSNAAPFKERTAYNPFQIYTELKFKGDWKAAKDSLKPAQINNETEVDTEIQTNEFPIDVFPEFFQEYILELKKSLNFHVDFSSAALMFTFSTLIGNKYKLKVKNGWEAAPIFWFACVGYPGTIKTHPIKTMVKPLSVLDKESKINYDSEVSEYNETDNKQGAKKPRFKQLLISDYTVEALHNIHDINKRGVGLYKDELKGFLNDMNKYRKGSDEEFWLESFNNGSYIVNRVTKDPIMVSDICINIIGTIQYDVLNEVVRQYKGNGLIDRFLFTAAEANVYPINSNELDDKYFTTWLNLCRSMNFNFEYNELEGTDVIQMTPEVFKIYQEIDFEYCAIQNNENESQAIKNYLSKMKTYVPRFALLFCIIDAVGNDGYIELEPIHMEKARKVANYFINTAKVIFSNSDEQIDIQQVESSFKGLKKQDKIIKLMDQGFKTKDICKFYGCSKQYINKIVNQKNK